MNTEARILIAISDRALAAEAERLLRGDNRRVTGVTRTGRATLEAVRDDTPDLIVLDTALGDATGGIETARRLRETSDVPIVFISNGGDDRIVRDACAAEPNGFVLTPLRPGALSAAVSIALRRHEAESHLRDIAHSMPDVAYEIDAAGAIRFISNNIADIFGYPPDEIRSVVDVFKLFAPEDQERALLNFKKTMGGTPGTEVEYAALRKDGSRVPISILAVPIMRDGVCVGTRGVVRDIAERKRTEEALRTSEQRYRSLFEGAAEGILVADDRTHGIAFANPAACRMLGYDESELTGMAVSDLHAPEPGPTVLEALTVGADGRSDLSSRVPCLRKDRATMYADITATTVDIDGRTHRVGFFTDVTSRKRSEEEISKLSSAVRQSIDGIAMCDIDLHIGFTNDAFAAMHGHSAPEMTGIPLGALCPGELMDDFSRRMKAVRETGKWQGETEHRKKDGSSIPVFMSVSRLTDADGAPAGALVVCRDMTEKRLLEKEIIHISEKERIRIGQDLHDGIGQYFTGLGYLFRSLLDRIPGKTDSIREAADEISGLIVEAKKHVHLLSKGYYPVGMDAKGIIVAVDELCTNAEYLFDISCDFIYGDDVQVFDNEKATHIYYIINESINNAVRHGAARHILVMMEKLEDMIVVSIEDDGSGFDEDRGESSGLGLSIMKYRASIIDGSLKIQRNESGGATVTCAFRQRAGDAPRSARRNEP